LTDSGVTALISLITTRDAQLRMQDHDRLLCPLIAANRRPANAELRDALRTIDRHAHGYITEAKLGNVA